MDTLQLAQQLIREKSISPEDCDCQIIIGQQLIEQGFKVEHLPFGPVKNIWAVREGNSKGPIFCFAGHTDVVPAGREEEWDYAPFQGIIKDAMLHGRGSADMKGSLAAMVTATKRYLDSAPNYSGTIAFLLTSDEEGAAINGTVQVIKELASRGVFIDFCLIGEPSSSEKLGDTIRVGRRGSLNAQLLIKGIQGHVAYPELVRNPIHECSRVLSDLSSESWDSGNEFFPPTTFQVSNIQGGTGANNVVPSEILVDFNFRFSTELSEKDLKNKTEELIRKHCKDFYINWTLSGNPFITKGGKLIATTKKAIKDRTGIETTLSTSGGTSDGRFISPLGTEVVELGPLNRTIHKVNEAVSIEELDNLSIIYERILGDIFKP
ncbi:MAG: succinyl-diaminopimelate desuccinylase [Gammaproteobacteria bacterium]|nr:succinyl-diaminopimelate desuccinylase [Gammaproteobacteria bacterium]